MNTCYALDLKDDQALIAEYEHWHANVWPEVLDHLRNSGISRCNIHRGHEGTLTRIRSELELLRALVPSCPHSLKYCAI